MLELGWNKEWCKFDPTEGYYNWLVKRCIKVKCLNLTQFAHETLNDSIRQILKNTKHLDYLQMPVCDNLDLIVNEHVKSVAHLSLLNVQHSRLIDDALLDIAVQCNPHLRIIRLWACVNLTVASVQHILRHCADLNTLSMYGLPDFGLNGEFLQWENLRQLKRIDMRRCDKVSDTVLSQIAFGCEQLIWLDVAHCVLVTNTAVCALLSSCRKLASLRMDCCVKLTDAVLDAVAARGIKMLDVSIYGCSLMTSAAIQAFGVSGLVPEYWLQSTQWESTHMADNDDAPC